MRTVGLAMGKRRMVSMSAMSTTPRPQKEEGSISDIFTSLTGEAAAEHPPRFAELKKEIWNDGMVESWRQVLVELEVATEEVAKRGSEVRMPKPCKADWLIIPSGGSSN
jgi:hypothetical protein